VHYVYILKLKNDTYYTGYSSNLRERIKVHEQGSVRATKNLRPVKLVFCVALQSKEKALDFEKYLKSSSGFAFRNKHFV